MAYCRDQTDFIFKHGAAPRRGQPCPGKPVRTFGLLRSCSRISGTMMNNSPSRLTLLVFATLVTAVFPGCDSAPRKPDVPVTSVPGTSRPLENGQATRGVVFREVARESGIDWTYRNGDEAGRFTILESMGGGLALCDYDGDHQMDLIAAGGGRFPGPRTLTGYPIGLFRQTDRAAFANVSDLAFGDKTFHYNHGIAAGDFDNDGFVDLAVTGFGGTQLLQNRGDGTFHPLEDALTSPMGGWSTSAGWGDFNGDSFPDLFVSHYADWSLDNDPQCPGPTTHPRDVCPPRRFRGLADQLFLSDGTGRFREVAREIGITSERKGIGAAIADLDLDGDLDIYVTNDTDPNDLYRNDGQGNFEDVGLVAGAALGAEGNPDGSMGVDVGDYDGDGLPDIWVTNFERETFALYHNLGKLQFEHVSRRVGVSGLAGTYVGWGTNFLDSDGDGDLDLFVANGHVVRFPESSTVLQKPLLLENVDGRRFETVEVSPEPYFNTVHAGRGVASGDIDGDCDPDLVVSHVNEPVALLRNDSPGWRGIVVRLVGRESPRFPTGAIVRVKSGRSTQVQQLRGGGSYASTSAGHLLFGDIGNEQLVFDIDWPSGERQHLVLDSGSRRVTIIEP